MRRLWHFILICCGRRVRHDCPRGEFYAALHKSVKD